MGSMQRTLRRNGLRPRVQTIDEMLFGAAEAPSEECLEERRKLVDEFRNAMTFMRAPSARACLDKLKQHYESWDHKQPSRLCGLVDNVMALRAVETEMRKSTEVKA